MRLVKWKHACSSFVWLALCVALASCGDSGSELATQSSAHAADAVSKATQARRAPGLTLIAGRIGGAGTLDGTAVRARFAYPYAIATDRAGNSFVADTGNQSIRKITPAGEVSTLVLRSASADPVDANGITRQFLDPEGIAVDASGNMYVVDSQAHVVRKISSSGMLSTFAGKVSTPGYADGAGGVARFNNPAGVAVDADGNVFVADTSNYVIRKITPAGLVSTIAGRPGWSGIADGTGCDALFFAMRGITVAASGDVYVADTANRTIRKITPAGVVTTLAGMPETPGSADGVGAAARFSNPVGIAVDASGVIYVADANGNTLRKITQDGVVTTLAGTPGTRGWIDADGAAARFNAPMGISLDVSGNIYVADQGNTIVRKVTPAGHVTTVAGDAPVSGFANGHGFGAHFRTPHGVAADAAGYLYVADTGNQLIRRIDRTGLVTTFAGDSRTVGGGSGDDYILPFYGPEGLATDRAGNVYVADTINNLIRKITPSAKVSTLAGGGVAGHVDGTGKAARFDDPAAIAVDEQGNAYVADRVGQTIRKITPQGVVTTLAGASREAGSADGSGAAARFNLPNGIAVDRQGNLYVADGLNSTIRKITPTGIVTTLAGLAGSSGSVDGIGANARFAYPYSIAVDRRGNVYVADIASDTIRKITPAGVVTTVAGVAGENGILIGDLPARLSLPMGIAVIDDGDVLAVVSSNSVLRLVLD